MIDVEEAITSKQVTRVDEARHLGLLWVSVVEAEMKTDHLETELAHALKSQRGASTTEKRPPRGRSEPLVTKEVWGTSRVADEVCLQIYNFSFGVCELIIQGCFFERMDDQVAHFLQCHA